MPEITGTLKDGAEAVYVGPAEFIHLDAPIVGGSAVIATNRVGVVTEGDGALPTDPAFALAPGRWKLSCNGRLSKEFTVPDSGGPYDLAALMSANGTLFNRINVTANTITHLRTFASNSRNFKADVISDANGMFAVYRWDNDATNADDGQLYIRPNDFTSAGLWVKIL